LAPCAVQLHVADDILRKALFLMPAAHSQEDVTAGLFVACAGLLLACGILMVYSSSMTAMPSEEERTYLTRQLTFLLVSGLSGIFVARLPSGFWKPAAPWLFAASTLLLVLVLVPGIGRSVNGAQRWFRLGMLSLQPSETAKLAVPMLMCAVLSRQAHTCVPSGADLLRCLGILAGSVLLILLEPDLGTAAFVGVTGVLVFWLRGCPARYFACSTLLIAPMSLLLFTLKPYQVARLKGFVNTWLHPEQAPYQVQQSLTTLGVGGLHGVGLGKGWQKLSFLPEANTDFVFAVVGEELGLIGTCGVIALWIGMYVAGYRLVKRMPHRSFEGILAHTLLAQLVIQAAMNMAVVTALLPPKGISHPFISYGGSNLLVSVIALGIIFSLTARPPADTMQAVMPAEPDRHPLPVAST